MSNLSKKDFAKLCGMDSSKLSIYLGRKKVIQESNGFFDTNNPINELFIQKFNSESKSAIAAPRQKPDPNGDLSNLDGIDENSNLNGLSLAQLEMIKKSADIEKLRIETRISLLKEEKLIGSAMPIEMVKTIISTLSKSFIGEFKNGADEIIRMLVKTKSYDHKEVAEIRGQLSKIINSAMSKSLSTAKKDMKVISENYSETRGVGEHD